MSRYAIALLSLLAVAAISMIAPGAVAEEEHTPTVIMVGNSTMLSIQDANRSEVNYSAYDAIYGTSVHVSVITAQLYLNGQPYRMANVPITFSSDNDSVAVLEYEHRTRPSDANGQAKILLVANNTVGDVHITARANPQFFEISDSCTVRVVGWGTVSGMVTDKNQHGVPYAKMTLWVWNGTANVRPLIAPDNPQLTNDGTTAAIGTYTYTYVPVGVYNLTAEKDNSIYFAMVYMTVGTYTANVAFPDYIYTGSLPATVTPTPAPTSPATPLPTPMATPKPTPSPGLGAILAVTGLTVAAWVVAKRRN